MILIKNRVMDVVADLDLHFFNSAKGPSFHDVGHTLQIKAS